MVVNAGAFTLFLVLLVICSLTIPVTARHKAMICPKTSFLSTGFIVFMFSSMAMINNKKAEFFDLNV